MGEKQTDFKSSLTVKECGVAFRSAIDEDRGMSAKWGGLAAKLMGGESLTWYTPRDESAFASLDDDPPTFAVGVGVPKAQGAHANGTNVEMYVWDRASHREVTLWAHHSLTGASHALKLMDVARRRIASAGSLSTPAPMKGDSMQATQDVATTPAGWHPDPHKAFELRYWDGTTWTEHVSTNGSQDVDHR